MEDCSIEIKKVIAALDLSAYSEITFTHALDQAKSHGAELIIVNVINDRGLDTLDRHSPEWFNLGGREAYIKKVSDERSEEFKKDYLSLIGEVPARLVFRVGLPYEELVNFAREEGADLIVTGTKGRGNIAGALFGSTAEKVFRRASCPVLSVRGPDHCRLPEAD